MTTLTLTTALLVTLGALTRLGWPRALSLAGATAAGIAFALSDRIVVPTFYAAAIAAVALTVAGAAQRHGFRRHDAPVPGMTPLLLFGLWTTMITALGGIVFAGTPVLDATGQQTPLGAAGLLTTSNIAQLTYLWIGVAVFAIVARSPATGNSAVGLGLAVAMALNVWALLHRDAGLPFPEGFFDNSPAFRFIDSAEGGVVRFRGIMPEPSAVAGIAIPALVFAVASLPRSTGWKRLGALALAGAALWIGLASTSTSFIVSGVVMLVVAVLVGLLGLTVRRVHLQSTTWLAIAAVGAALVFVLPQLMDLLTQTLSDKLGSSSYEDRSGADTFSFALAAQTLGIGVGLGSNRPSSLLAALVSQTGVLGLVLFVAFVVAVVRPALRIPSVRPVLWVAVAMFLGKVYNGPDLSDSTGLLWLVTGTLAAAVLRDGRLQVREGEVVRALQPMVPVGPPPPKRLPRHARGDGA
ncbi:hypothetical protein [Streptomyces sp. NP160]|uniref:hypothetical protein n=1 Tax=Streptomyces sp. NP160 TaxID=2586637 RepID=UPI0015D5D33B|nr:hypothetical protein [Streptomyces sp. NP160]